MKAITVRNLPPNVTKAIREKAKREGLSLNRTVAKLLAQATGHAEPGRASSLVQDDLDEFSGVWTKQEAEEFDASLKEQRSVNPEDWR
jgi:hypothetical protein